MDSKKVLKNKSVDLIFTSPPFPLKRKKKYGNLNGEDYINWLVSVFSGLLRTLKDNGSIVIEIGNAWDAGVPVMSILPMKTLLALVEKNGLYLCQQFVWYNKAKLPTPAQWVNVKRVRVKDAFTHIWWLSKTPFPKANNKKVLVEYSDSMKALLKTQKYNFGKRPSEHVIGEKSFLKNNSGAIPSNVLISSNTQSSSDYLRYCKENNLTPHPARMPSMLPEFFIEFLTEQGNVVLDPFGGSNTTGEVCEKLKRKWISVEPELNYIQSSKGRFYNKLVKDNVKNN
ncbi:MAG: site-specific DNA-methyltransferase [Ignavibacteriaceae bacterium]|nr:site-specific DNA-methyltransferase [Ignavibacteriaceae bacterium]